jgi:NitT/TauT family transport system permease protein
MKEALKRLLIVPNLLFIILMLVRLLPDNPGRILDKPQYTFVLLVILEIILLLGCFLIKNDVSRHVFTDILGFIYVVFIIWILTTAKFQVFSNAKSAVFPPPGAVIEKFFSETGLMLVSIRASVLLILQGYFIAIVAAIPLGLILGWKVRVGAAAGYIAKFFSSISPIVYIPYAIVLLPTFRAASVFVIFVATFWPVLAGTMSGVLNVEKRIIDSGKVLALSWPEMLFRVILPASLPQIFIGCNQGLSVSFILLISAEMIGARSGLGFYVNNYANFGNYVNALAGVILIGVVVTFITFLFNMLQRFLLRWKQ